MAEIIIKDWEGGISDSPISGGFADVHCVDIYSEPGLLKTGFVGSNTDTAGTVNGLVLWMKSHDGTSTAVYAMDENGKVYTATQPGNAWTNLPGKTGDVTGSGLVVWKNHVIALNSTLIDAYQPGSSTWVNQFTTTQLTSDKYHPSLVGQDDIVYIGHGRYIASIQENSGFF